MEGLNETMCVHWPVNGRCQHLLIHHQKKLRRDKGWGRYAGCCYPQVAEYLGASVSSSVKGEWSSVLLVGWVEGLSELIQAAHTDQCLVQRKLWIQLCYYYLIPLDFGLDREALVLGPQCFLSYPWAPGIWESGPMTGPTHSWDKSCVKNMVCWGGERSRGK